MAETISTSAEREKRDLVAAIAARGKAGYEAKEAAVQPNLDLAAAAAATVAADPVDLNTAQSDALAATAGAPAASAAGYSEALRAIFESGRGREEEYMGQRYGAGHDTQVTANNAALGKYDAALAADAAARAASARSYGGGGNSNNDSPLTFPSDTATAGQADYSSLPSAYNATFELPLFEEAANKVSDVDFGYVQETAEVLMAEGMAWANVADVIREYLVEQGLTSAEAIDFTRGLQTKYSPDTMVPNQTVGPGGNQMAAPSTPWFPGT